MRKRPPAPERKIFADNMRRLRRERRVSQEMLAELADLHRTFVGVVERCETNISIDNMSKIARALNHELYKLLIPAKSGTRK